MKKLYRSRNNRAICGVCGGFGQYLGVDPFVVRLLFVLISLTYGVGFMFYIICSLLIPLEPEGGAQAYVDVDSYVEHSDGSRSSGYDGDGGGQSMFEEIKKSASRENIGIALVIIGAVLLAKVLFPGLSFNSIVAVLALAAGAYILLTRRK